MYQAVQLVCLGMVAIYNRIICSKGKSAGSKSVQDNINVSIIVQDVFICVQEQCKHLTLTGLRALSDVLFHIRDKDVFLACSSAFLKQLWIEMQTQKSANTHSFHAVCFKPSQNENVLSKKLIGLMRNVIKITGQDEIKKTSL